MVAELHPRDSTFFKEPLPGMASGPPARRGYLAFSEPYRWAAAQAREQGWVCRHIDAEHFHMMVAPDEVADAIVGLARRLQEPGYPETPAAD